MIKVGRSRKSKVDFRRLDLKSVFADSTFSDFFRLFPWNVDWSFVTTERWCLETIKSSIIVIIEKRKNTFTIHQVAVPWYLKIYTLTHSYHKFFEHNVDGNYWNSLSRLWCKKLHQINFLPNKVLYSELIWWKKNCLADNFTFFPYRW